MRGKTAEEHQTAELAASVREINLSRRVPCNKMTSGRQTDTEGQSSKEKEHSIRASGKISPLVPLAARAQAPPGLLISFHTGG